MPVDEMTALDDMPADLEQAFDAALAESLRRSGSVDFMEAAMEREAGMEDAQ